VCWQEEALLVHARAPLQDLGALLQTGFNIMVQPAAIACASLDTSITYGKFQA